MKTVRMHGGPEICAAAIFRTGAGLCAGPGYAPPNYPPPGSSSNATTDDLNRQELNRLNGAPSYPWPPRY